jgi:hypothetical protein
MDLQLNEIVKLKSGETAQVSEVSKFGTATIRLRDGRTFTVDSVTGYSGDGLSAHDVIRKPR